ncbi:MAG: thioredoxin family protein [Bacilli bacterium]|nr:thioredoxin family protein [Bacilli bacterium]
MKRKKEVKKQNKKYMSVIVCVLIIIGLVIANVIVSNHVQNKKSADEKIILEKVFAKKGISLVYLGRDTCSWSQKFEPHLNYLRDTYGFTYEYIDTDLYSGLKLNKILNKLTIDPNEFGTPTIVVMQDGKVLDTHIGYLDEKPLFEYLKEKKIIKEDADYTENTSSQTEEQQYPNITTTTYQQFEELYNKEDAFVLVIGQTGCTYCNQFKPVMNEVSKEENVTINYIDIKTLSEEDSKKLVSNIDYFDKNSSWGTPLTLVIKNKKTVADLEGYTEAKELKKFFKKNNIIK